MQRLAKDFESTMNGSNLKTERRMPTCQISCIKKTEVQCFIDYLNLLTWKKLILNNFHKKKKTFTLIIFFVWPSKSDDANFGLTVLIINGLNSMKINIFNDKI